MGDGRPVPPHSSGQWSLPHLLAQQRPAPDYRRDDPDETEGRALYRRLANRQARQDTAIGRMVRFISEEG